MDKFEYKPATFGAAGVNMDGDGGYVGTADNVRSRIWARELGKHDLLSATRCARECEVDFACDFDTADKLREAADADMLALTPGTFIAQGEWRQRGYIVESNVKGVHFGWLNTSLVLALLDGAWWRLRKLSFLPEQDTSGETHYQSDTGKSVRTYGAAAEPLHALTIYGESVQIGTPTPSAPIPITVVEPQSDDTNIYINCGGTQTAIDMDGNFLASLPDGTQDVLEIDSAGAVTLTKRVGRVVLDGVNGKATAITNYSSNTRATIGTFANQKTVTTAAEQRTNCLCDLFAVNTMPINNPALYAYTYCLYSDYSFAVIPNSELSATTAAGCNTWFASHNTTVYYPLATEQTITLDPITMPDTSDGGAVEVVAAVTPTITAEWQMARHINLDFPHDYSYDYSQPTTGASVDTGRIVPCKPFIVFYGSVTDPEITIAGNKYKVSATIPVGGRIEIDGREKTVKQILQDGTVTDKFADALRGSGEGGGEYIFQPIPAGEHSITWNGTFGVDIGWYDEVGEPPWNQS